MQATCTGDLLSQCSWVPVPEDGDYCSRNLTADELLEILQEVGELERGFSGVARNHARGADVLCAKRAPAVDSEDETFGRF